MRPEIERLRRERESTVEVDGHKFTYRRPRYAEAPGLWTGGKKVGDKIVGATIDWQYCLGFVIGWDLTQADMFPGTDPEPCPFDHDVFMEWVQDQPGVIAGISKDIVKSYYAWLENREKSLKNS